MGVRPGRMVRLAAAAAVIVVVAVMVALTPSAEALLLGVSTLPSATTSEIVLHPPSAARSRVGRPEAEEPARPLTRR